MCKNLKLYPHTEDIYKTWLTMSKTEKDILVILGCGLGKTGVAAKIIYNHFKDKPVLYVLPTYTIEEDIKSKDFWNFDNVKFIMYHSLHKIKPDDYSLCIFDEGHRVGASTWLKQFKRFKKSSCVTLTMTATDCRSDGMILHKKLFNKNNTIHGLLMLDAIERGIIRKPRYASSLVDPEEGSKIIIQHAKDQKMPEEHVKRLAKSLQNQLKFDEMLKKYAMDRKRVLLFASHIKDVNYYYNIIKDVYKDALVFKIHSKLPREEIIESLSIFNSDTKKQVILLSVNMLNEGIHPKDVDCVLIVRDTSSLVMYTQQIGRLVDITKPQKDSLILDFIETHKTSKYMALNSLVNSPDDEEREMVDGYRTINAVKRKLFNIVDDYYTDTIEVLKKVNLKRSRPKKAIVWTKEMISKLGTMSDVDFGKRYDMDGSTVCEKRKSLGIESYGSKKMIKWTDEMISKLGTMFDKDVAKIYNIHPRMVTAKRNELGIPPYAKVKEVNWTDDMISKLGTMTDRDVGRLYNIAGHIVTKKRTTMGIPRYFTQPQVEWTDEMISKLGKMTDPQIAKLYKIPQHSVRAKREVLKIPAFNPYDVKWTKEMISKLGTMGDNEFAIEYGISKSTVSNERKKRGIPAFLQKITWTDEMISKLGTMSDASVAKLYGTHESSVRMKRVKLGIPTYAKPPVEWTDEMISKLGTITDADIAKLYDINPTNVTHKRIQLGIPAFKPRAVWTKEMISKLGTMSDADYAKTYNISKYAAQQMRAKYNIPAYQTKKTTRLSQADKLITKLINVYPELNNEISQLRNIMTNIQDDTGKNETQS